MSVSTRFCSEVTSVPARVQEAAQDIVKRVRSGGDAAVRELTEKFEARSIEALEIEAALWDAAIDKVEPEVAAAVHRAAERIRRFHRAQVGTAAGCEVIDGGRRLTLRARPLDRVGLYVPGGTARYPSSVLMTAIPARVAGVKEIVMVTPGASPETLVAARVAGVDRVFEIGGAQAVAALAYGTESVPRVDKIVGPGNIYVAAAKRVVFGDVAIDAVAGPSEVLIVADGSVPAAFTASDLLAQAEHDVLAQSILVAVGRRHAAEVAAEVDRQLGSLTRGDVARRCLAERGAIIVVDDVPSAVRLANTYAPEHLGLHVEDARELADSCHNAGAIFVGAWTPEAAGDYYAGPNHVLPTGGSARFASPLGVYDFVKYSTVIEYDRQALGEDAADIERLSEVEGLTAHGRSVTIRTGERIVSRLLDLVPPAIRDLAHYTVPRHPGVVARLNANESPFPLTDEERASLAAHVAQVPLHRYPDAAAEDLRRAAADDLGVLPDRLVVGNGSDELIHLLIAAFGRPRDGHAKARVVYAWPSFVVFRMASITHGAEPVEVPLAEDFTLDEDAFADVIRTARPNLVFFPRPNNPTGGLWPESAVLRALKLLPDGLVIVDEAYADYAGTTMLPLLGEHPNLIVMRTLSKVGMAALRVGFLVLAPVLARELDKIRQPYNIGSLNQAVALWHLVNRADEAAHHVRLVVSERDRLTRELGAMKDVRCYDSAANFLLFRPGGSAQTTWRSLLDRGVLVRSFGDDGPLAGCLRVTVGTTEENDLFLEAIASSCAR